MRSFLLTPLREGRRKSSPSAVFMVCISTHAPAGGATVPFLGEREPDADFYSRPCGRGDARRPLRTGTSATFLLTPLREGRQGADGLLHKDISTFLLTPLREGRHSCRASSYRVCRNFYSRPCGRGDNNSDLLARRCRISTHAPAGGATRAMYGVIKSEFISTHAPAGGATGDVDAAGGYADRFLLTPLREGRPEPVRRVKSSGDFYSRPCGRGDLYRFE